LRVPTLADCCGPAASGGSNAAISSSGSMHVRFGPVMNSVTGTRRVPRTDASSTTASPDDASSMTASADDASSVTASADDASSTTASAV
jgi:hypothetical protein